MQKLFSLKKGLLTALTMIGLSLFFFYGLKEPVESKYQYAIYTAYTLGIVWSIVAFNKIASPTTTFKEYFSAGFKTFIIVTLLMVIYTTIFYKLNPQILELKININNELALKHYNHAIELKADYFEAYFARANVKSELGFHQQAVYDYDKAIDIKPDFVKAYNYRGYEYYILKEYKFAIQDYNKVVFLKADYPNAYVSRGDCKFMLNDLSGAEADYNKGLELKSDFAEAFYGKGNIYMKQKTFDKAVVEYTSALAINMKYHDAQNARGKAYFAQKLYKEAEKDFSEAIKLKPDFAEAWYNRANTKSAADSKPEKGCKDWTKAAELKFKAASDSMAVHCVEKKKEEKPEEKKEPAKEEKKEEKKEDKKEKKEDKATKPE